MAQEMMVSSLNLAAKTRRIYVDNRLSLQFYYRTATNLLKQASIYRDERNVVDLYVILLRFSSLLSDTIPDHHDYRSGSPWERAEFKRKLADVLDELEALKPEVERELDRRNKVHHLPPPSASPEAWAEFTAQWPSSSSKGGSSGQGLYKERSRIRSEDYHPPPPRAGDYVTSSGRRTFDEDLSTLSLGYQRQKGQAPSRHSVFTPNVLRQQNSGVPPSRAQYPIYVDASQIPPLSSEQKWHVPSQSYRSSNRTSDSVPELRRRPEAHLRNSSKGHSPDSGLDLTLVSGSARPESHPAPPTGHSLELVPSPPLGKEPDRPPPSRPPPDRSPPGPPPLQRRGAGPAPRFVRQPDPPPTLAPMRTLDSLDHSRDGLPPEQVAGIRSGSPQHSRDESGPAKEILHLHVSIRMMEEFLALSRYNTKQNLETCAVLGGFLKKSVFYVSTLIIPKQEATSDSCQTLNEEEIFDFQDKRGLFQLGWIHTHPTQTCFMSSIDLHTHYSYQIMLSEAIAIVMAPTDSHRKYGIFRLSDTGGIKSIQQCQERGFHPHKEPPDGSPIYEHCGHVYMSPKLKFDVIDLRQS